MNSIYIIGHPGAGKALIAKEVAQKLGWKFVDADFGLEFRVGQMLDEILGKEGETSFLECQLNLLSSYLHTNSVITTDGSIVCSEKNRQFLSQAFVVNLQVSTTSQIERVARQPIPLAKPNIKEFFDKLEFVS